MKYDPYNVTSTIMGWLGLSDFDLLILILLFQIFLLVRIASILGVIRNRLSRE